MALTIMASQNFLSPKQDKI